MKCNKTDRRADMAPGICTIRSGLTSYCGRNSSCFLRATAFNRSSAYGAPKFLPLSVELGA